MPSNKAAKHCCRHDDVFSSTVLPLSILSETLLLILSTFYLFEEYSMATFEVSNDFLDSVLMFEIL